MIKWMDSISNKCCSSSSWDIIIYVVQHKAEAKWQRCALSCHTLIKLEKDLSSLFNLLNVWTFHFGLIIRMEILMAYTFIVGKSRDLFLVSKFNIVQESFIWWDWTDFHFISTSLIRWIKMNLAHLYFWNLVHLVSSADTFRVVKGMFKDFSSIWFTIKFNLLEKMFITGNIFHSHR